MSLITCKFKNLGNLHAGGCSYIPISSIHQERVKNGSRVVSTALLSSYHKGIAFVIFPSHHHIPTWPPSPEPSDSGGSLLKLRCRAPPQAFLAGCSPLPPKGAVLPGCTPPRTQCFVFYVVSYPLVLQKLLQTRDQKSVGSTSSSDTSEMNDCWQVTLSI
ncbi:uncharacterized protein LOC104659040 [Rhinopithecus roxellana]|uniref:uncharacterized protein LOC104659040 n=1 Tax=Rhinopithecus roxellana TaxID=61622 RepID=UPI000533181F|nr:uncharacterized protein LOC104659040 [Rhinopithecus roxellana]XP_017752117.1 PREDICTED: uncharacterized protein LOC108545154 [Rhinopithecus bieti]